jgi:hypothetical protein
LENAGRRPVLVLVLDLDLDFPAVFEDENENENEKDGGRGIFNTRSEACAAGMNHGAALPQPPDRGTVSRSTLPAVALSADPHD